MVEDLRRLLCTEANPGRPTVKAPWEHELGIRDAMTSKENTCVAPVDYKTTPEIDWEGEEARITRQANYRRALQSAAQHHESPVTEWVQQLPTPPTVEHGETPPVAHMVRTKWMLHTPEPRPSQKKGKAPRRTPNLYREEVETLVMDSDEEEENPLR